jgi:putative spermidine/putrescine transport system substrate-binding protein
VHDFWNTEKFPGQRGMRRVAEVNFEWALMADGVPVDQVYEVLGTEEGVKRAFKKLDEIKDSVIWWEAGAQAPQLLADGEVVMTTAYNGRLYNAIVNEGKNFVLIWNTQVWDLGFMAIVKGAPNKDAALKLMAWYSNPERMANQTNFISYPPPRLSAMKYVSKDVQPHLPTYPDNIAGTLQFDAEFWADNKDDYEQRFAAWLTK